MAKQTFTVGQVLTAAQVTSLQQTAMGGGAASAKTASYTLVAADAGTTISMTSTSATTITVNTGLFAAGDTVFIQNLGSGNLTVTAGTATVSTAGSAILPTNDAGILYFVSTGASIFYDFIQVGAASPLTTKGDLYGFGTSDDRIPIGANNTVLTADSNETLGLKWATPAGGGKVLQVVNATTSTEATVSSGTFADTNLTATITPTVNTSKILVLTQQLFRAQATGTDDRQGRVRLRRDSTTIWDTGQNEIGIFVAQNTTTLQAIANFNYAFLDSPATTSAITYKTQCATGSDDIKANYQSTVSSITLLEIGA